MQHLEGNLCHTIFYHLMLRPYPMLLVSFMEPKRV
ncbi:callose synthase 10-like [Iris pallida]|uniref:Callose synthase 10-like n=1 Tax=Iris pallida TaxID=29817 RepID=A0AAX6HKZ8_IRIPA|nr:callose synthase 10-like [Iris pallida]